MVDLGTDIGFGLVNRRTILAIIFSMVLAVAIGDNFQFPVNTENAANFFFDLVILVSYFYCSRSIIRIPVALISSPLIFDHIWTYEGIWPRKILNELEIDTHKSKITRLKVLFLKLILVFSTTLAMLFFIPTILYNFAIMAEMWAEVTKQVYHGRGFQSALISIGNFFDRISIVIISIIATVPVFRPIVTGLGIIGLFLMIGIFVFQGGFTALIKDAFQTEEEDKLKLPEVRIRNSPSDILNVKIVKDDH